MDSSQRVPPMSPCPPLIITMVCPQLINHLSDPWDFNKSNRIQLRSNWRKPYPKFYGSELLLIKGDQENDLQGRVLTFWGGEGWLIRCWHYIYIYVCGKPWFPVRKMIHRWFNCFSTSNYVSILLMRVDHIKILSKLGEFQLRSTPSLANAWCPERLGGGLPWHANSVQRLTKTLGLTGKL